MPGRIILLTGERGVGKTTVCHKTVDLAQTKGFTCGGVLTLSYPTDERDVLDVGSGRARCLTLPVTPSDQTPKPGASPAVIQGRFRFDPATLAWGSDALTRALGCHLLVVDELGPLELERGGGWVRALDVLHAADFALALVVVRPELLDQAQAKLPARAPTVLTVTLHNRDDLPVALLGMLEREFAAVL
jgi:nucleoside-triphosphatase THEP1